MKLAELVNQHYNELSENDLYIWDYIQSHQKECKDLSIVELARRTHVSKTTILRFAQKLSLKGYSELKVYLSWENRPNETVMIDEKLIEHVCDISKTAIDELKEVDFTDICEMLYQSKRVFAFGTGALQNSVAKELERMFLYCGELIHVLPGEKETEMVLPYLNHDDVVILISLRGEGEVINEFASQLRLRNIPTISMTRLKNNDLAHKCSKSIYITTSKVMIGNHILHEASNLYFVLAELLFLRYSQYKQKMDDASQLNMQLSSKKD